MLVVVSVPLPALRASASAWLCKMVCKEVPREKRAQPRGFAVVYKHWTQVDSKAPRTRMIEIPTLGLATALFGLNM